MTWAEFINSDYNDGSFTKTDSTVEYDSLPLYVESTLSYPVMVSEIIISNGIYTT